MEIKVKQTNIDVHAEGREIILHSSRGIDGANGANGSDGKDGKDGKDGETPYIGENGHWFIGNEDTGVNANGGSGGDGTIGSTSIKDLPLLQIPNPFAQYLEVLDTDNVSKKTLFSSMIPNIEEFCSYGIEFDTTISTPKCTRIGNFSLHRSLPIQNKMRGCLLNDLGEVVEYLNPNDWTEEVRDGSIGQVMVELPSYYRKFETIGTKRRVWLSEYPIQGFSLVNKKYVSAYEACLNRATNTLSSVVNTSVDYRGGDNYSTYDDTATTLLGRPVGKFSAGNLRTYARNRGDYHWNINTYDVHKDIFWLFAVEYATLNTAENFNAELTSDGFKQGGLGSGVRLERRTWSNFNGERPFVPCGYTDTLGNNTGVVIYDAMTRTDTLFKSVEVPRYRGIENLVGHIYKFADGLILKRLSTGEIQLFVCNEPQFFASTPNEHYVLKTSVDTNSGYMQEVLFGDDGDVLPLLLGAGSTTYFASQFKCASTNAGNAIARYGGSADIEGTISTMLSLYVRANLSTTYISEGTRLCFIP